MYTLDLGGSNTAYSTTGNLSAVDVKWTSNDTFSTTLEGVTYVNSSTTAASINIGVSDNTVSSVTISSGTVLLSGTAESGTANVFSTTGIVISDAAIVADGITYSELLTPLVSPSSSIATRSPTGLSRAARCW